MKHLLVSVYKVCSNKSPWLKLALPGVGDGRSLFFIISVYIMNHLLIGVFQVCSNKSPGVQTGPAPRAYIQVSDLRAIMALLYKYSFMPWYFSVVKRIFS
jgi:hypothetical protein